MSSMFASGIGSQEVVYNNIKHILSGNISRETIQKAQEMFDKASSDEVWSRTLGDLSCSYHSWEKTEKDYKHASIHLISNARRTLAQNSPKQSTLDFTKIDVKPLTTSTTTV